MYPNLRNAAKSICEEKFIILRHKVNYKKKKNQIAEYPCTLKSMLEIEASIIGRKYLSEKMYGIENKACTRQW